jgi:hypothetical protein
MLTQQVLKSMLRYEEADGNFYWIVKRKGTRINKCAGSIQKHAGYLQIRIQGITYYAHRLAVLWMTGSFPQETVDHLDGNRLNNSWKNLRICPLRDNLQNRFKNREGHLCGTSWNKQRGLWIASILINGKKKYLGAYHTMELAHSAYLMSLNELKGGRCA